MNRLQKWAMLLTGMTAMSLGPASPALAISAEDVAVIARACVALDRGELTEADLTMLNDTEYAALMNACGFVSNGSVSQVNMATFEEYYVVFQADMVSFETVVEEHTIEVTEETTIEEYSIEEESLEVTEETEVTEEYSEESVEAEDSLDQEYSEETESTDEEYSEESVEAEDSTDEEYSEETDSTDEVGGADAMDEGEEG